VSEKREAGQRSPVPPGAFVELTLPLVDEGECLAKVNRAIRRAMRGLRSYEEETDDKTQCAVVSLKLKIKRTKGAQDHFDVTYGTKVETPEAKRTSIVKERNGKLLCQPAGSNEGAPEQQLFYDAKGRIIGGVDPETGEVADPEGGSEPLRLPRAAHG
jgi:hypothetical protein